MSYFAFISYSTKDLEWANRVREMLRSIGLNAYVAEDAWGVGEHSEQIISAIRHMPMLVLVWSKAASESAWVRHEIGVAHGAGVPIVVFSLEPDCPLPDPIRGSKYADAKKDPFAALTAVQRAANAQYQWLQQQDAARIAAIVAEQARLESEEANKFGAALLIGGGLAAALVLGLAAEDKPKRRGR